MSDQQKTIAQVVMALVSQGKAAVTLEGGYAVDYAGKRTMFAPGHVVSEKRNKAGRCTALVVSYKDNSVLSFTWSENAGARYQVKPSIKGSN
jgi:hypothetical protein